jgi:GntR family transcriptional repressor for pyruvate dehydrogenase complex
MSTTNASGTGSVSRADASQSPFDVPGSGMPYHAVRVTRSYEGVVRQIAASIRNGQIGGGERLPTERELSAAFGVSRGVVREAIKVLDALGMVEARQGSGVYVLNTVPTITRAFTLSVSPDLKSVEQLFEFRRSLEVESASLAAVRRSEEQLAEILAAADTAADAVESGQLDDFGPADNAFHAAIARASGNPYFEVAVATARQMQLDVVPLISDRVGSFRSAIQYHRAIAEAIAVRDPEGAARAMAEHIVYTADAVMQGQPAGPQSGDEDGATPA